MLGLQMVHGLAVSWRDRGQRGQAIVLAALFMGVLLGAAGMSIDLGRVSADHRRAQSAADGAAMGAAYQLYAGAIQSTATSVAELVVQQHGLATSAVAMSYTTSGGSTVVAATVTDTVQSPSRPP